MRLRTLTALAATALACAAPTAAAQEADEAICNPPSAAVECETATRGDTSSEPAPPSSGQTPCSPKVSTDKPSVDAGQVSFSVSINCPLPDPVTATVRVDPEGRVVREQMEGAQVMSGYNEVPGMEAFVRLRVPDATRSVTVTVTDASGAVVGTPHTVKLPKRRCDPDYEVSVRSRSKTRATVRVTVLRCKGVRYTVRTATGASTTQGFGGLIAAHNQRRARTSRARRHGVKQTLLITTRLSRGDDTIRVVVSDGKGQRLNPGTLVSLDA